MHLLNYPPSQYSVNDMKQFCCEGISINLHISTVGKLNPKFKLFFFERPYCYHAVDGRNPEQVDS